MCSVAQLPQLVLAARVPSGARRRRNARACGRACSAGGDRARHPRRASMRWRLARLYDRRGPTDRRASGRRRPARRVLCGRRVNRAGMTASQVEAAAGGDVASDSATPRLVRVASTCLSTPDLARSPGGSAGTQQGCAPAAHHVARQVLKGERHGLLCPSPARHRSCVRCGRCRIASLPGPLHDTRDTAVRCPLYMGRMIDYSPL